MVYGEIKLAVPVRKNYSHRRNNRILDICQIIFGNWVDMRPVVLATEINFNITCPGIFGRSEVVCGSSNSCRGYTPSKKMDGGETNPMRKGICSGAATLGLEKSLFLLSNRL